jgi:hypothetical protein
MVTKERVRRWLERNFFLRIHMSLILGGTVLTGVAATNLLLNAGLTNQLALRYGLAVVAAYCGFLVLFRLWLMYVRLGGIEFDGSGVDALLDSAGSSSSSTPRFSGGGSDGSWGSGGKSGFDFDFDDGGIVIAIVFLVLIAALLSVGIYFVYTAPALFTDALFEVALAGALVNGAKKAGRPGWVGAVWRATVWPFLGVLALSVILGWVAHAKCPHATRLREAISCVNATVPPAPPQRSGSRRRPRSS